MLESIFVRRSLAETRSAPMATISLVLMAQVCGQRCVQPGQDQPRDVQAFRFGKRGPADASEDLLTVWATSWSSSAEVTSRFPFDLRNLSHLAGVDVHHRMECRAIPAIRLRLGSGEQATS